MNAENEIQNNNSAGSAVSSVNKLVSTEFAITANESEQTNPDIDRNIIVWQDNRNGDCKVDFIDYTLMASQWLECNLEPKEACLPF